MSKIIKSAAVVDRRPLQSLTRPGASEDMVRELTIIKPRQLGQRPPASTASELWKKDSYLEELGELMEQVEEAKAALRETKRQIEENQEMLGKMTIPGDEAPTMESVDEVREEMAKVVAQAQRDAEELLDHAAREAELLEHEAKERGYKEGFAAGKSVAVEQARAEFMPQAEKLSRFIGKLSSYEQDRLRRDEPELVRLCAGIAQKIVARELETDPTVIKDMLWEEVDRNHREEYIKIILAADLLPVETVASEEIRKMLQEMGANVTVQLDKEAAPGTLMVETPIGMTDLTVSTQIENLEDALLSS